ncbi:mismatch repair endonuclease PMS2 isoform X2 [Narcine bancroftii]
MRLLFDSNGHISQKIPHPRQQGTTVNVQQLFNTLPVRHKEFLRNIKKEYSKMVHMLQAYCIISTGVRITCTNQIGQGKKNPVVCTSGCSTLKENISAVFGSKQLQSLVPFVQLSPSEAICEDYGINPADIPEKLYVITGFVSQNDHGVGRSSTDRQFFFINRRPCDPVKISKLVNEVYHLYNRHQYPFVALNVSVDSECVDVNVTPDKRQILLQDEKLLLAIMKTSLIQMYDSDVNKLSVNQKFHQMTGSCEKVPQTVGLEASVPNEQESAPVPSGKEKSISIARLHEAFSLHQSSFCQSKFSKKQDLPKQRKLHSFLTHCKWNSPHSDCRTGPFGELPSRNPDPLEKNCRSSESDTDSGKGSMSFVLSGSYTPEAKSSHSSDSATSSPITLQNIPEPRGEELKTEATICDVFIPSIAVPTGKANSTENSGRPLVGSCSHNCPTQSAKHARIEGLCLDDDSSLGPGPAHKSEADRPVEMSKKTVKLPFSMCTLAERLKLINKQQTEQEEAQRCRLFRAQINPRDNQAAEEELRKEISKDMFATMEVIGQFNLGFIVTKLESDLFIVDQHATDEKYNFEMLQQHTILQGQKLIAPQNLHLTAVSENILMENMDIFRKNGFDFITNEQALPTERVKLVSLPMSKNWTFGVQDIEELIFMLSDSPGVMCRPSRVRQMFASRACRKSVMIGTALTISEMKKMVTHMGEIEHPWNCPHGRPTMRHLINLDMISVE